MQQKIFLIPEEYNRITSQFLLKLEENFGIIEMARMQVNIPRTTLYNWRKNDPWFDSEVERIKAETKPIINDIARRSLIKNLMACKEGTTIFYLKTRDPEFMERTPEKEKELMDDLATNAEKHISLVETIKAINQALEDQGFAEEWQNEKVTETI